ncbi:AAA domain-containing protein [Archaeoglobus sp.]
MKNAVLSNLSIITAEKVDKVKEIQKRAKYWPAVIEEYGGLFVVETNAEFSVGDVVGARDYLDHEEVIPNLGVVTGVHKGVEGKNIYTVKMLSRLPEEGEWEVFGSEHLFSYELQERFLERVLEDDLTFSEKLAVTVAFDGPLVRYRKVERMECIGLDKYQCEAVKEIVSMDDGNLSIIVGPPGTGKTRVIVRTALKLFEMGERVLITSHTNRAVDSALERISPRYCVRVGNPDKVAGSVMDATLEAKVMERPEGKKLKAIDRAIERAISRKRFADLPDLYGEREELLDRVGWEIVSETPIVGATILKSAMYPLSEFEFDVVMIDEASQITLPLALLGMSRGRRYALVGDHHQLPPVLKTVRSPKRYSAFTYLKEKYPDRVKWLRIHYRSNPGIVALTRLFYEQSLIPAESCQNIRLEVDGENLKPPLMSPEPPVVFLDVPGREEKAGGSKFNLAELETCGRVVRDFVDVGVDPGEIAVVAPYRAQVDMLRNILSHLGVEVGTVDAFQGREKDVIVFSVTATGNFYFAADPNRLNVAFTRARKKLVIVGNGRAIMKRSDLLSKVLALCTKNKGYLSVKRQVLKLN